MSGDKYYKLRIAIALLMVIAAGFFAFKAKADEAWPYMPEVKVESYMSLEQVRACLNAQVEFYEDSCAEQVTSKNVNLAKLQTTECVVQEVKSCLGIVDGFQTNGDAQ